MEKPAARKKRGRRQPSLAFPSVEPRKIVKVGKTYYVSLPPSWLKAHHINPAKVGELLVCANTDIAILHPRSVPAFTRRISRLVRPAGLPPHRPALPQKPRRPKRPRRPKKSSVKLH